MYTYASGHLSRKTILWLAESFCEPDNIIDPFLSTWTIKELYKLDFAKNPDDRILYPAIAKAFPFAIRGRARLPNGKYLRGYHGLYLTPSAEERLRAHLGRRAE